MRLLQFGVLVLLNCLAGSNDAVAQQPPGNNQSFWHRGVGLLGDMRVKNELKLTAEQLTRIKEIGDDFIEQYVLPFEKSTAQDSTMFADLKKQQQRAVDSAKNVLTPEQAVRYRQIEIWISGPLAYIEPEIVQELDLTDEQKLVLKTINDEYRNERSALAKSLGRELPIRPTKEEISTLIAKRAARTEELRVAKEAECLVVLTDEQKARFEKLRGPKFDFIPVSSPIPVAK